MTKYRFITTVIISAFLITLVSCNGGTKSVAETKEEEVIPEDIVELRGDQIGLANIEMGPIETRSLSGTLKVSGTVATAPQNLAAVSMPSML